jgi:hypothetical protein
MGFWFFFRFWFLALVFAGSGEIKSARENRKQKELHLAAAFC